MGHLAKYWPQDWQQVRRKLFLLAGMLIVVWAWFAYAPPKPAAPVVEPPVDRLYS